MNLDRRRFFYTTAWGGIIGMSWPGRAAAGLLQDGMPVLVVIQLAGGNDGLNTVVPVDNDHYYRARPKLAIPPKAALPINESTGLHPVLAGMRNIHDVGQLAIIEGVGYPHPNRSHFRSTEIWHTGSDAETTERHGWLGRYFDHYCSGDAASIGICIGQQNPQAFAAALPKGVAFSNPRQLNVRGGKPSEAVMQLMGMAEEPELANAGGSISELSGGGNRAMGGADPLGFLKNTAADAKSSSRQIEEILKRTASGSAYPNTRFAHEMQVVSQLIRGRMPTRIFYLSHGGFDTHVNQAGAHAARLQEWSDAMQSFMKEITASGQAGQVCVMVFSEFGRRVAENGSGGTDHGVAAPVLVAGGAVRGGLHGRRPGMAPEELNRGDIVHTVDYRSVYATLLEKHLGVDSRPVLRGSFEPLEFLG